MGNSNIIKDKVRFDGAFAMLLIGEIDYDRMVQPMFECLLAYYVIYLRKRQWNMLWL